MMTNKEIRNWSWEKIRGNWGVFIVLYLIMWVISGISFGLNDSSIAVLFAIMVLGICVFVTIPVYFGVRHIGMSQFVRGEISPDLDWVIKAFTTKYYFKGIGTYLLQVLFIGLWSLLLVVPGIIKACSYAMAMYIMADEPTLGCNEAIEKSMAMMKGHKMDLFLMGLGMCGWLLLGLLTLGIAYLWIIPYYEVVFAKFYVEVKAEYEAKQVA